MEETPKQKHKCIYWSEVLVLTSSVSVYESQYDGGQQVRSPYDYMTYQSGDCSSFRSIRACWVRHWREIIEFYCPSDPLKKIKLWTSVRKWGSTLLDNENDGLTSDSQLTVCWFSSSRNAALIESFIRQGSTVEGHVFCKTAPDEEAIFI